MNVGGITSNYPMEYGIKRTQKTMSGQSFANTMGKTANVNSGQIFTLHCLNNELGEKPIGAKGLENGGSTTVYKPVDFDPANPVYRVRIWDAEGNMTERMVDISKVDPKYCDVIDMYAYACHLTDSGEFPDAQFTFFMASSFKQVMENPSNPGGVRDNCLDKYNWLDIVQDAMQSQYEVGNFAGYMAYKKFWDFLTQ